MFAILFSQHQNREIKLDYENQMTVGNANHDAELPQEWRDKALDEVIDVVMMDFQWPKRRSDGSAGIPVFDLIEWTSENYGPYEMAEIFLQLTTDYTTDADMVRLHASEELERKLREHFEDSEIVRELGSRMMDEEGRE
jgi:hypothetical protein